MLEYRPSFRQMSHNKTIVHGRRKPKALKIQWNWQEFGRIFSVSVKVYSSSVMSFLFENFAKFCGVVVQVPPAPCCAATGIVESLLIVNLSPPEILGKLPRGPDGRPGHSNAVLNWIEPAIIFHDFTWSIIRRIWFTVYEGSMAAGTYILSKKQLRWNGT